MERIRKLTKENEKKHVSFNLKDSSKVIPKDSQKLKIDGISKSEFSSKNSSPELRDKENKLFVSEISFENLNFDQENKNQQKIRENRLVDLKNIFNLPKNKKQKNIKIEKTPRNKMNFVNFSDMNNNHLN